MKITCQSCQAKYTIADEKVLGKVVKIRCKKCQETIVVNGVDPAPGADVNAPAGDGDWTVNVADGDQRNMSVQQIAEAFRAGVVHDETYCWRDGMEDWLPIREIDELYRAATAAAPPQLSSSDFNMPEAQPTNGHAHTNGNGAAASMFGAGDLPNGGGADLGYGAEAPVAARRAGGRAGGDLFGAAAQTESEAVSSAGAGEQQVSSEKLTGQRNENSVLFSLAALTDTAAPSSSGSKSQAAPMQSTMAHGTGVPNQTTATTDGSGLIDIRALSASMTSPGAGEDKKANVDDIMNLGGGGAFGALSAPILAPATMDLSPSISTEPQKKSNSTVLLVGILGAGAMIAGAIVFVVSMNKQPVGPIAGIGSAGDPSTSPSGQTGTATGTDPSSATAQPVATDPGVAIPSPTTSARSPGAGVPTTTKNPGSNAPAGMNPTPAKPETVTKAPDPTPPPASPPKTLEQRMAEASSGGAGASAVQPSAPTGNVPFDRGAAQASLGGVNVASCKKPDGPTGSGHVVVTFGPDGSVQSAVVDAPPFSGTAVGGCVAGRYRGARVPAFSGSPVKVGKSFSIN